MFNALGKTEVRRIREDYELVKPCDVSLTMDGEEVTLTIPKGFRFNGANFGWLLFWRKNPDVTAALVHDYFYPRQGVAVLTTSSGPKQRVFTRKECDKLFCQILDRHDHIQSWRSWLAYMALRALGWIWWKT